MRGACHEASQFPDQRSEIKSMLLAVEAQILNCWTSRKSPKVVSCILFSFVCLFVFGYATQLGSQFPNQGLNPEPRQWKQWVLTTRPPRNSPKDVNNSLSVLEYCSFFFEKKFFLIYFAALGLSCGMLDIVPWPALEPRPLVLEAWNLPQCTAREVPILQFFFKGERSYLLEIYTEMFLKETVWCLGGIKSHGRMDGSIDPKKTDHVKKRVPSLLVGIKLHQYKLVQPIWKTLWSFLKN